MMICTVYRDIMVGVCLVFYQGYIAFGRKTVLITLDTDFGGNGPQVVVGQYLSQQD